MSDTCQTPRSRSSGPRLGLPTSRPGLPPHVTEFRHASPDRTKPPHQRRVGHPVKIVAVHSLNADLHSHSTASDGTLTSTTLAQRAKANGVELWALTDHDELSGLAPARAAAGTLGLAFVDGIEISVTFAGTTVHIVGLGIDPANDELVAGIGEVRAGRELRAKQMGDGLAQVGIKGAYEGAIRLAPNPNLVSRTHFGRFLINQGIAADMHAVFRRFLTEGKPGYVEHRWAKLGDAVRWITRGRRRRGDRAPGPLQVHADRGVRAVLRVPRAWRRGGGGRDRQPPRRRHREVHRDGARVRPARLARQRLPRPRREPARPRPRAGPARALREVDARVGPSGRSRPAATRSSRRDAGRRPRPRFSRPILAGAAGPFSPGGERAAAPERAAQPLGGSE